MSASVRELILEAILAALTAPGGPTGLAVKRYATFPTDPAAVPAIKFYRMTDPSEPMSPIGFSPVVKQKLDVRFECYAAGTAQDGSASDAALDAMEQWVEQRMLADPTFGGLALYVVPVGSDLAGVAEDRTYVRADLTYQVVYARRLGDLTTRA